jgi:hypothetical protein
VYYKMKTTDSYYSTGSGRFVAGTAEDGEAGIFRKITIRLRKLAEQELRAFGGRDDACVDAVSAKA